MLSDKGRELIALYREMAEGYDRDDGKRGSFDDFELRFYRESVKTVFEKENIKTVLDYGGGGSDWNLSGFDGNQSAIEYFNLDGVKRYEPARDIDERSLSDCVVCFDVLEHVFITDVPTVLRDIFKNAGKLVFLNIACYDSAAVLPNGENAHITVRPPMWWRGVLDVISTEYPEIQVALLCSTEWRETMAFPIWKSRDRDDLPGFWGEI